MKVVDQRKIDLARIHVAKKALGLDDEEYRSLLWAVCNVRSSAELDISGRQRFLAHLQACGWTGQAARPAAKARPAWGPSKRRIWALWQQLADAGLVNKRDRGALEAWLKHHVGVDKIDWLNRHQEQHAIEQLKAWLGRAKAAA